MKDAQVSPARASVAAVAKLPEPKADHATVTCSRCNRTWDADENPYDTACVGLFHHDLHGNSDGEGVSEATA